MSSHIGICCFLCFSDPLFKTVIKSGPSAPVAAAVAPPAAPKIDTRAIWSAAEIDAAQDLVEDDESDGRVKPEFDILYGQSLSAEDVFMNLSLKDGSTVSCETIVVKIQMPGASMAEMTLDVTATRMIVTSHR